MADVLIANEHSMGRSGRVSEDCDPYTNEILVRIPLANEQDLDEAYLAAAEAQPKWAALHPPSRRSSVPSRHMPNASRGGPHESRHTSRIGIP